jgi:hypothetical protein
MINWIVKKLTGKEIVFVHRHRNTIPIVEDNRDKFIFFDPSFVWMLMGVVGRRRKLRYRMMYRFLSLVKPVWIIHFNWLDQLESLYLVWANNHEKQFVVVQHGIYYGGIMRDIPEKYIKCNVMLVWSDYFREMFLDNNPQKDFRCISFGNPIYNQYERSLFEYPEKIGNKVLLAPSLVKGNRLKRYYALIEKLLQYGFDVSIKEHYKQAIDSESIQVAGCHKTDGDDFHLYRLLKSQEFGIVITDVSSAMTDIIFFKNRVIYFSPEFNGVDFNKNMYSEYLPNLNDSLEKVKSSGDILSQINVKLQEGLLEQLIKVDNISNNLNQIAENNRDIRE